MDPWQEIAIDIALPHTRLTAHLGVDIPDDLIEKSPCTGCRIEDLDAVRVYGFGFTLSLFVILLEVSPDLYLARISESSCESEV